MPESSELEGRHLWRCNMDAWKSVLEVSISANPSIRHAPLPTLLEDFKFTLENEDQTNPVFKANMVTESRGTMLKNKNKNIIGECLAKGVGNWCKKKYLQFVLVSHPQTKLPDLTWSCRMKCAFWPVILTSSYQSLSELRFKRWVISQAWWCACLVLLFWRLRKQNQKLRPAGTTWDPVSKWKWI